MRRKISSKLTIFHKFILPALLLAGILISYIDVSMEKPNTFDLIKELYFIGSAIVGYLFLWFDLRSKEVSIEGDFLYVSNFSREIKIPLSEIKKVTEFVFLNHDPVTIHLKNETRFGKKIIFIPTYRYFNFFSSHPIVSELRRIANAY